MRKVEFAAKGDLTVAIVEIPATLYKELHPLADRQRLSVDEFVVKVLQAKLDHHAKTKRGLDAARKKGAKPGHRSRLTPAQIEEIKLRRWNGEKILDIQKHFPQISRTRLSFLINHTD